MRPIPEPAYCACGCGEMTNARQIEFIKMRNAGWRNVEIAEAKELTPGGVKAVLGKKEPSRFKQGHVAIARMAADSVEWKCERCGKIGHHPRSSRWPAPRYCQRMDCMAKNGVGFWPQINASVERARRERQERMASWFARRKENVDQRLRRRERTTPEGRRRIAEARWRFVNDEQEAADRWLERQSPDIQQLVRDRRELIAWWEVRLDAPLRDQDERTLHDVLSNTYNPRPGDIEWHDPTAEQALSQIEHELLHTEWDLLQDTA